MARRVLRGMGVVEVGHALIPVVRGHLAGVGSRDERHFASHLDLGLKGERLVPLPVGRGLAVVHQEQGHGAGSGSDPACEARGVHGAGDHVEGEPPGVGYPEGMRVASGRRKIHRNRFFAGSPLPPTTHATSIGPGRVVGSLAGAVTVSTARPTALVCAFVPLAGPRSVFAGFRTAASVRIAALRFDPAVIAPPDDDVQQVHISTHEEAQPHGRGEEALLRRPPVFRGVVPEPGRLRHFGLLVHVRVATLPGRRPARDQEPGEIPVGRPHPSRKALVRQWMSGPRPDQIKPERTHDLLANLHGFRQTRHVASKTTRIPCIEIRNETTSTEAAGNPKTGERTWSCPPAIPRSTREKMSGHPRAEQVSWQVDTAIMIDPLGRSGVGPGHSGHLCRGP